jgi:hypothetical protein
MVGRDKYEAATAEGRRVLATTPHAVAARYDWQADRIVVTLNTGLDVSFSPRDAQGLENASAEQLAAIEITPRGFGLHWPKLDADLYVPAVLEGILGSRRWMAARLGAAGGRSRSKARPRRVGRTGSSAAGLRRNCGGLIPPPRASGGKRKRQRPQAEPAGECKRWRASRFG